MLNNLGSGINVIDVNPGFWHIFDGRDGARNYEVEIRVGVERILTSTNNDRDIWPVITNVDEDTGVLRELKLALNVTANSSGKGSRYCNNRCVKWKECSQRAYGSIFLAELGPPVRYTVRFIDK